MCLLKQLLAHQIDDKSLVESLFSLLKGSHSTPSDFLEQTNKTVESTVYSCFVGFPGQVFPSLGGAGEALLTGYICKRTRKENEWLNKGKGEAEWSD